VLLPPELIVLFSADGGHAIVAPPPNNRPLIQLRQSSQQKDRMEQVLVHPTRMTVKTKRKPLKKEKLFRNITYEVMVKTMEVKKGKYKHYKGGIADVIGVAFNSETLEEYVAYYHAGKESGKIELWVRPKKMFFELVAVNGKTMPRFKFIGEE
jgi:hypothetical protein